MNPIAFPRTFLDPWSQSLKSRREEQLNDFPNYHVSSPDDLVTSSTPRSLTVGNGASIYKQTLLPAILAARHEVILVTCFWADSETLHSLNDTLYQLASRRREAIESSGRDHAAYPPLRFRICFSSRSFFQKIFHPRSRDGYVYPSSAWTKLGLPADDVLKAARIELSVKSLFFLPFSVMHPKFVIVDRERAWMPSCNVSWESWFEGCVEFTGPAVTELLRFYSHVWDRHPASQKQQQGQQQEQQLEPVWDSQGVAESHEEVMRRRRGDSDSSVRESANSACQKVNLNFPAPVPTIILPSSHHCNPGFRYLPFFSRATAPSTPLNAALLTLFTMAHTQIDIVTPNLTCGAVVDALIDALGRGVNVRIRTSRKMMLIEQLVTAFTTTERTLKSLKRRYNSFIADYHHKTRSSDPEAQIPRPGNLEIYFYRPDLSAMAAGDQDEPVVSHLKMTLVDREYLVLGSGNLDRASWYTSQELGILMHVPGFQHDVWDTALESRTEVWFRGGATTAWDEESAVNAASSQRRLR